ncbi:unnamed protein product [Symbiodinium microadriaticum]|nr:unnamed protein product [Symbiodinium microadriaticum]
MAAVPPAPPDYLPGAVTKNEAEEFIDKNLSADLVHIFNECSVSIGLQYSLGQHFTSVKKFSTYADTRAEVRQALKDDLAMEPVDQQARAAIAAVVSAWESCREYSTKQSELKAEARVMGVVRPITQTEKQAMRSAYEQAYGSLDESVEPSDDYVSSKTEEVESGEIVASSLTEVTSKRNAKTMGIQTTVDTTGHVRLIKQKSKGEMPQNTEQLRTTLRIEGNMWCFMASKYKNKVFFRDMSPEIWLDYANYLLGDKCYLMQVPTPGKGGKGKSDLAALRPPWIVVLNYEYEMRREAVKRASQRDAWQKRPNLWGQEDFNKWQRNDWKGPKKGKDRKGKKGDKGDKGNKGGGKGDAKNGKGTTGRTPDGRLICYAYSNEGCDGNCGMVHCCQVRGCFGPHPTWKHWQDHFAKNDANKQKTDD